jgi:hypothetical protein
MAASDAESTGDSCDKGAMSSAVSDTACRGGRALTGVSQEGRGGVLAPVKLLRFEGDRGFGGGEEKVERIVADDELNASWSPKQSVSLQSECTVHQRSTSTNRRACRRIRNAVCQLPHPHRVAESWHAYSQLPSLQGRLDGVVRKPVAEKDPTNRPF